jgi:hypothetical protein
VTCVAVPNAVVPFPKSHAVFTIVPSGSYEPDELNATTNGAGPVVGNAVNTGTGFKFVAPATTVTVADRDEPPLSVTVNLI